MNLPISCAAASLPPTLQGYVAPATGLDAPRAIPPAERIIRQLTEHIKAALSTRGTDGNRSFDVDVSATRAEEQDLATALWALQKSGYSAAVRHLGHDRQVVTLSW
jgi:hypothetical protein